MIRQLLLLLVVLIIVHPLGVAANTYLYDASTKHLSSNSFEFISQQSNYEGKLTFYRHVDSFHACCGGENVSSGAFFAFVSDFLVTKGGAQSLVERGADLVKRNGDKNRVSIRTPNGRTNIDLAGKSHNVNGVDVPTPHVQNFKNNLIPSGPRAGQVGNRSKLGDTRPATAQDLRTVDRFLKFQGR